MNKTLCIERKHFDIEPWPGAAADPLTLRHGFVSDGEGLAVDFMDIAYPQWVERERCEKDETLLQVIPYVLVRWQDLLFHYTRSKLVGDERLRGMNSIGVGGHPELVDDSPGARVKDIIRAATYRELQEEIGIPSNQIARLSYLGIVRANQTPVDRVHIGIVFGAVLKPNSKIIPSEEMMDVVFVKTDKIDQSKLETWSKLVLASAH